MYELFKHTHTHTHETELTHSDLNSLEILNMISGVGSLCVAPILLCELGTAVQGIIVVLSVYQVLNVG